VMRVKGTAFLWHQVRCMAAVLFMVGYGHEAPTVVAEMLDVHKYVRKPQYLMAPELPLVLVSCGFQGVLFKSHPGSVILPFSSAVLLTPALIFLLLICEDHQ
jgi:tRNA pseudouridine38/39 synthase